MQKRCRYIDIAKGISILVVLFYHGGGVPIILPLLTGFFLPVFFISRGFITDRKRITDKRRCVKGVLKEIKIYFLSSIFLSAIYIVWKVCSAEQVNYGRIVLGIIYGRYSIFHPQNIEVTDSFVLMNDLTHPLWFLPALAISSLLFYLIVYKWSDEIKLVCSCGACIILAMLLSKISILLPWSLDTVPVFTAFMIFGYCLREFTLKNLSDKWTVSKQIAIFVLLFVVYACLRILNGSINIAVRIYGSREILSVLLYAIIGCLGTVCVYIIGNCIADTMTGKVLEYIGKRTLFIYVSHMIVFTALKPLIQETTSHWFNTVQWLIIVLIAVLVGLGIDWTMKKIVKRERGV